MLEESTSFAHEGRLLGCGTGESNCGRTARCVEQAIFWQSQSTESGGKSVIQPM
jgi:hypothetical protein